MTLWLFLKSEVNPKVESKFCSIVYIWRGRFMEACAIGRCGKFEFNK